MPRNSTKYCGVDPACALSVTPVALVQSLESGSAKFQRPSQKRPGGEHSPPEQVGAMHWEASVGTVRAKAWACLGVASA
ncbi:hypothetical protein D9M69_671940 [compost metagenome]